MIDPIEELAALAQERGIGMHTDACLGGFFLPWAQPFSDGKIPKFDFSVPGVTAMSCDTHKVCLSFIVILPPVWICCERNLGCVA
jgi:glutamate/tyrosine decarboxylase-like PLP-dependent enzyme